MRTLNSKSKIPEKLAKELLEEEQTTEEEAVVGENRGQLFVRIPKRIKNRLHIKKGHRMVFKITGKHKESRLSVKVVKL